HDGLTVTLFVLVRAGCKGVIEHIDRDASGTAGHPIPGRGVNLTKQPELKKVSNILTRHLRLECEIHGAADLDQFPDIAAPGGAVKQSAAEPKRCAGQ